MPKPSNVIVIMSDEHSSKMLGCAGHPFVATPHLDRLAGQGTRFSRSSCNSPVCVPSRAVFATGRYIHQAGFWARLPRQQTQFWVRPESYEFSIAVAGPARISSALRRAA